MTPHQAASPSPVAPKPSRWRVAVGITAFILTVIITVLIIGHEEPTAPYVPKECECAPTMPRKPLGDWVVLSDQDLAQEKMLLQHFSPRALSTANICGMIPLLRQYCSEPEDSPQRRIIRQKLSERIATVALDISSTSAEMDCEEERADQIADYLIDVAHARIKKLTLWSILLGAIGSTLVNGLALWNVDHRIYRLIGILFGLAVAAISLTAITAVQTQLEYSHQRNGLAELYQQAAVPTVFPPSVWNYLNRPDERDGNPSSLRVSLLHRWEHSGELGAKPEAEKQRLMALLFGTGGSYRASELRIRANLFDQLESYINLMKHDLEQLAREIAELP